MPILLYDQYFINAAVVVPPTQRPFVLALLNLDSSTLQSLDVKWKAP